MYKRIVAVLLTVLFFYFIERYDMVYKNSDILSNLSQISRSQAESIYSSVF